MPIDHAPMPIAQTSSAEVVESAIREIPRGRIDYTEFVHKTTAAGCVGYFAQLTGRRVVNCGRDGDVHVEPFPAPVQR